MNAMRQIDGEALVEEYTHTEERRTPSPPITLYEHGGTNSLSSLPDENMHAKVHEKNGPVREELKVKTLSVAEEKMLVTSQLKTRRFCCGCFGSRKSCLRVWIPLAIAIMCALAVILYFLAPRIPTVTLSDAFSPSESSGLASSAAGGDIFTALGSANKSSPLILTYPLAFNVSITSANYVPYYVNRIQFSGVLLDSNGKPLSKVTAAGTVSSITVQPRTTTTSTLNININYKTEEATIITDPALLTLLTACTSFGSFTGASNTLYVQSTISVYMDILTWVGYVPTLSQVGTFQCPLTQIDF